MTRFLGKTPKMIKGNKTLHKAFNLDLTERDLVRYLKTVKPFFSAVPSSRRKSSFGAYRKRVRRLTEEVRHLIPGIEKRGFKNYHIDHKISIWHGYKNGIAPEVIASIDNLRMLPYKENMLKGRKCE